MERDCTRRVEDGGAVAVVVHNTMAMRPATSVDRHTGLEVVEVAKRVQAHSCE